MKTSHPTPSRFPAYSYIRFSTRDQARGDSIRRQRKAALTWCEKNGGRLDESLTFRDLGKSAYLGEHRKNPDRFALASFLKLVQDGRIARGSYLIVEALDRLTREHVRAALMLLLGLIEAGVRIVQLSPTELVYDETSDEMALMLAIVELSRGHRESKRKSDMIRPVWEQKRKRATEMQEVMTGRLPAWVEERGGKLCLIPARAAAVQRIFHLAAEGYGVSLIARKLREEDVTPFGRPLTEADVADYVERREAAKKPEPNAKELAALRKRIGELGRWEKGEWIKARWARSYVGMLLIDRRVLGECQPRLRTRKPIGQAIPTYYPVAVSEELWLAARAGAQSRREMPGRTGERGEINLFANLIREARTGNNYITVTRITPGGARAAGKVGTRYRVLVCAGTTDGSTPAWSFPYPDFEEAILKKLAEVDPREVLGQASGPDEVLLLKSELTAVEDLIGKLEVELLQGDVAALAKVLRLQEAKKRDLVNRLAEARVQAASPVSEAWGETGALLSALKDAPDPEGARLRLRSVLRRIVKEMLLLVVARGRDRLAAVQLFFADSDRARNYLLIHWAPRSNKAVRGKAHCWVRSLADVVKAGDLDLRRGDHAKRLEAGLHALDLAALTDD